MRQVNGWGFKRIVSGNDHNSYYHEMFVRDMPQLCMKMKRIKKGETEGGGKKRKDADEHMDEEGEDSDGHTAEDHEANEGDNNGSTQVNKNNNSTSSDNANQIQGSSNIG